MSNPTNKPAGAEIDHPDWCDPTACTATPAATVGEAHRGVPTTITFPGTFGELEISASLHQPHTRWLTNVYVILDVAGMVHDYQPVTGRAMLRVEQMAEVATLLADLAATGKAWRDRLAAEKLAEIQRTLRIGKDPATGVAHPTPDQPGIRAEVSGGGR
jgi:hypothetical protein